MEDNFKIVRLDDGDLALQFPNSFIEELGLEENDTVNMEVLDDKSLKIVVKDKRSNGDVTIMLVKTFRHKNLEERAAEYGGQLHLDDDFD